LDIETVEVNFELPGKTIKLTLVKDIEKLITDPCDEDKVPCWADIWPAARGISYWIWKHISFNGQEVLELGAGLGLPGVVCGLKGARVTFSDFNQTALDISSRNARLNGLVDFDTLLADWRTYRPHKRFNWVVGSDIFYDPKLNSHLLNLIPAIVAPGGGILAAHPGRPATFDFIRALGSRLDMISEREYIVPVTIDDPYFPYYEIHVHHISLA